MTPFIERRLSLATGAEVILRFYQPEPDGESCYRCEYQIDWPDRKRKFCGFGVDSVQALTIAMQMAHVELLTSAEGKSGALSWLGEADLGLPLAGEHRLKISNESTGAGPRSQIAAIFLHPSALALQRPLASHLSHPKNVPAVRADHEGVGATLSSRAFCRNARPLTINENRLTIRLPPANT